VYIVIENSEKAFKELCAAIDKPELADDPKFTPWQNRQLHKDELYPIIEEYTKQYDKFTLTDKLGAAGVPVGPVLDWHEIENDSDLLNDGTIPEIDQGGARGKFKTIGLPFTMSNFKPDYKRAPDLGENNAEILEGLGYTADQVQQFTEQGVLEAPATPHNPAVKVITYAEYQQMQKEAK
uniref:CoA transferase n=1 Tax=uncultured Adlercreutzia sp. TaxID=875803 RepID=UPI0026F4057B